jgi:hypothetical protein
MALPHTFVAGQTARAADVNENFEYLDAGAVAGAITLEAHGAVGDGATNDAAALQAALNALNRTYGGRIVLQAGKQYLISSTCDIPADFSSGALVSIEGYGASLKTTTAGVKILRRMPANQAATAAMIDLRVHIKGIHFVGSSAAGQKGIELGATYASHIADCQFTTLDTGCDLQFCLMPTVERCRATACVTRAFIAQWGTWSGAGTANSQSNSVVFRSCRIYSLAAALSAIEVIDCNGYMIEACITEGFNTVNNIVVTNTGTNARQGYILNLHSENVPTNAIIKISAVGGSHKIDGVYHQSSNPVFVDASGSTAYVLIHVWNINYLPTGSQFKRGASAGEALFDFMNIGPSGQADLSDAAYWVGGLMPDNWRHRGFNAAGGIYPKEEGSLLVVESDLYIGTAFNAMDKVLTSRRTGWAAPTGTATRTAFDTATVTTAQLAERLKALIDDLRTHGLVNT